MLAATADRARPRRAHRRETRRERESFRLVRQAEQHYAAQLRKVARQVGSLADVALDPWRAQEILRRYAETLRPWARATATAMLADVRRRDERAWLRLSQLMGSELEVEIRDAPIGKRLQELMDEQIHLITSIPLEAAQRVHQMATANVVTGTRAEQIAKTLLSTGLVARSRANLIARTEVGRSASALTQARAEYVGSPGYIWRSLGDSDVRPLHRRLNGSFHKWDDPPIAGEAGERSHPGAIYNCRCYSQPIIT